MAACLYCKKDFDILEGFGNHCSRKCAQRNGNSKTWSDEELSYLAEMTKYKPIALIASEWSDIARKKGWIDRTYNAIKVKATRLFKGHGVKGRLKDNISQASLAKRLNISCDRIQRWEVLGLRVANLSKDKEGRPHIKCISYEDLTEFARSHPDEFWGIAKNKLETTLTDKNLARAIFKSINQPTIGRPIAVVDLKNCKVYPSAKNAASVLDLTKHTILHNAKLDFKKDDYHKHNFAQLNYPVWWISKEHAPIMHEVAGDILCELHDEYIEVEGYSKQRFLSIAIALAVRMTIGSLRKYWRDYKEIPNKNDPKFLEARKKLKKINEDFRNRFAGKQTQDCYKIVHNALKRKVLHIFERRVADKRKVDFYLNEFASDFMTYATKFFKKGEFLPKNWEPKTTIEKAFYWATLLGYVLCMKYETKKLDAGESKMVMASILKAYQFIQDKGLEFSATEYNEAFVKHQPQTEVVLYSTLELFEQELVRYIKSNTGQKEAYVLEIIVQALNHDFSDKEIASQLQLSKDKYFEYKEKLQHLTKQFMKEAEAIVF